MEQHGTMKAKDLDRLRKLFALLGSDKEHEREGARKKLDALLKANGKTWNDLPELLGGGRAANDDTRAGNAPPETDFNALDLVHHLIEPYCDMKEHEAVAVALWILHTHVYSQFAVTPRLALTSPVRGCGKTTLLRLIELLAAKPERMDSVTPAAIYRLIEDRRPTLLIDEADNAGLMTNPVLRSVLNSGHLKGGGAYRVVEGVSVKFSTFAPMAIAAIGTLPLPLMQRSVVIHLERTNKQLKRLPEAGTQSDFDVIYPYVWHWAKDTKLNADPDMPRELKNRAADNWRPLLAIADALGWGDRARDAARVFARTFHDEDAGVILLEDCRTIFDRTGIDRLTSEALIAALLEQEGDISWSEWRGMRDDQQPRKLSQGELARLLRPFRILPRSMRVKGSDKTRKGYLRASFESAWARYCSERETAAQKSNIRYLDGRRKG
jgi:hypothetical protein